jgi:hypothetical protein
VTFRLQHDARILLAPVLDGLNALRGEPVTVRFRDDMGPVHAGSDLRRRLMLLEADLLRHPDELRRIFIHEAYHFVWARLGNPRRWAYEEVVAREWDLHARGELGWSAQRLKDRLKGEDRVSRSRKWREYVCESFCDTAAWKYAGLRAHAEWTLGGRFREERARCLGELLEGRILPA